MDFKKQIDWLDYEIKTLKKLRTEIGPSFAASPDYMRLQAFVSIRELLMLNEHKIIVLKDSINADKIIYKKVEQQNKRYREARKKIEEKRNEYKGYLLLGNAEGLEVAMTIIDEALEGEE